MNSSVSINIESQRTLNRLLPRLEAVFFNSISADPLGWQNFIRRLDNRFPVLFSLYFDLFSGCYDFFFHIEDLLFSMATAWFKRPSDLRELDMLREAQPLWFQSNQVLGGVIYIDLFANNLEGVRLKIPYFKELGLTYLHLMPFFKAPEGESDGGYAVSNYREVHSRLGTMQQLASLARDLRAAGISLVVDLVFNHTSDEHIWAEHAKAGERDFQDMYRIHPDRIMPDAYERTLREIFPDEHSGAFTFSPSMCFPPQTAGEKPGRGGWVWTTFHSYQWDLNYSNPMVFNRMVEEMLFLANQGVEVLRLDAVAFIWKQLGTNCENLPEVHKLIRAFNVVARIAAPALVFKSEAIVHPDEIVKYIDPAECQLSYNPLLMAMLWNSLATRQVNLLAQALVDRAHIDPACAWVNYVRCHDDIGWTFSDHDAAQLGINGGDHRHFLNNFYLGRFPGSFARGLPFQESPKTGDCRISGTCASLAGLEKAINEEGPEEIELAIRRILLIHGVIMTIGGIPLLYLGDEVGTLNDYSYRDDPSKSRDSRWVHRPGADWEHFQRRRNPITIESRVNQGLLRLIELRKTTVEFSGSEMEVIPTNNEHVLAYTRMHSKLRVLILANFSENHQQISDAVLSKLDISRQVKNRLHGITRLPLQGDFIIAPYDFLVIR